MIDTNTTTADGPFHAHEKRCCGATFKRPWSLPEIGAVIGGFVLFWPLGIAALAMKFVKGEVWPGASEMGGNWKKKDWGQWHKPQGYSSWRERHSSGNAAFDDYRRETLERLEAERRKLEETQRAFGEHLAKLRKAKDKEEFDRFMSEQSNLAPKAE